MQLIETLEPVDFKNYLKQYDNTICGRHPIAVFLNVHDLSFLKNYTNNNFLKPCLFIVSKIPKWKE
jgi:predicted class III extradiol MEMO1 family dioxygenase